jgi:hypothetical protein
VLGLTGADYLLWSWSLAHGPRTVAFVCGVALVPLLLALVWMLVVRLLRLLADRLRRAPPLSPRHLLTPRAARQSRPIAQQRRLVMRRRGLARRVARSAGMRTTPGRVGTPMHLRHDRQEERRQPREGAGAPSSDRLAA